MRDEPKSDYLELITLNDAVVSFSRLFANTVRYHHWHQCLEILYVEEGFGVAIVDNRHYTMAALLLSPLYPAQGDGG